jgi:hypothetical protein
MQAFECPLVDIRLQARPSIDLDGVSTPNHLLFRGFLGNRCAKALCGRGNAICMARSCSRLYQPWKIQDQGGASLVFVATDVSPNFRD